MTSIRSNSFFSNRLSIFSGLILPLLLVTLSGCTTYIASKQDDVLTQIDIWYSDNEFGKAFDTIKYVKPKHPQYHDLQKRKKFLQAEAHSYEKKIHKKIVHLIQKKRWREALNLIDEAIDKYPQSKQLPKTEAFLLKQQGQRLALINRNIMIERSQWLISTRPIYESKYNTDPRNDDLKDYLDDLNDESETLAQRLTELSRQAIKKKHYITARTRIDMAIALAPTSERKKIASQLKNRAQKKYQRLQQARQKTHKKQQNSILQDIEKNFKSGNLLKTRQLILSLDKKQRNNPELMQLELELNRSINIIIQGYLSEANRLYTEGEFHQAIDLWEQVLKYDPNNVTAKKNIIRAQKVIKTLTDLREKQHN